MSKIQKELCEVVRIDPSKYGNDRAGLHTDIVKAVNKLTDKEWDSLTQPAQDWFNNAADATKAKKSIAEFPDYSDEPETRSRRRSSSDDDGGKSETMAVEKLKEGDRVKLTTKRGKSFEGTVVEQNSRKSFIAIKGKDGEDEIDWNKVDSVEVFHGNAGMQEEPGPQEGDEVEFTTTRGKTVRGLVTELSSDTIVIDKNDDYDITRIAGDIKIIKKGGGGSSDSGGRRSSSDDDKGGRRGSDDSSSSGGGKVSVGGRIRELLAEDPTRTKEDIDKVLKREKVDYREASLNVIFRDSMNLIKLLRDAGHMKK